MSLRVARMSARSKASSLSRMPAACDAGVGDGAGLIAMHDLAVLQQDLGLNVGSDVDADDLGSVVAVDEQW